MSSTTTMSLCAICSRLEIALRKNICTSCEQTILHNENYQHQLDDASSNTNVDSVSNEEKIDDCDSNIDISNINCKIMNTSSSEISSSNTCANCGKEGSDVTNTCNKCNSVMYCNAACKKKHRKKHKKECERRAAELHDEKLFKQPPQLEDDCPICFLRIPTLCTGRTYMNCCGKVICRGCTHAFQSRVTKEKDHKCPFCRTPTPTSYEEIIKRYEKRAAIDDKRAIYNMGVFYSKGLYGLPQNRAKAVKLWHRAGDLGCAEALNNLGNSYKIGYGNVERDETRTRHYYELSAMMGDAGARYNLGVLEGQACNEERAVKHLMIAVKDGNSASLAIIKEMYKGGFATKDDYAKALRSYQAYLDEIRSDQRDEAAAADDDCKYYESVF